MEGKGETRTVYDRSVLYEEVWADSVKVVAARYGVSDVALAKNCRRMGIPLLPHAAPRAASIFATASACIPGKTWL